MAAPRILAVDIGTGTQDILVFEAGTVVENAIQLVMPSPTALVAERVRQATVDRADLFLNGVTMGGGPGHWAVEAHLRAGLRVYATAEAARKKSSSSRPRCSRNCCRARPGTAAPMR